MECLFAHQKTDFPCFQTTLRTSCSETFSHEIRNDLGVQLTGEGLLWIRCFERLHNRFHRIICGKLCVGKCLPLLSERRDNLSVRLLVKLMNTDHVMNSLLPFKLPSGRLRLPTRRTTRRCRLFFPIACEMYNSKISAKGRLLWWSYWL